MNLLVKSDTKLSDLIDMKHSYSEQSLPELKRRSSSFKLCADDDNCTSEGLRQKISNQLLCSKYLPTYQ